MNNPHIKLLEGLTPGKLMLSLTSKYPDDSFENIAFWAGILEAIGYDKRYIAAVITEWTTKYARKS